jgi:hypothetical protein
VSTKINTVHAIYFLLVWHTDRWGFNSCMHMQSSGHMSHSYGRITVIINWRESGTAEANKHPARPLWSPKVHYHSLSTALTKFIQPDIFLSLDHYHVPSLIILNSYYYSDHINDDDDMGQACNVHGTTMQFRLGRRWEDITMIQFKNIFHTFVYYQIQYYLYSVTPKLICAIVQHAPLLHKSSETVEVQGSLQCLLYSLYSYMHPS